MGETKIIEIRGQGVGGLTTGLALSIDRTYPNILRGKMSNDGWLSFCNKIDEALKPASAWMSRVKYLAFPLFLGVLGTVFGFWLSSDVSATEENRNLGRILIPTGSVLAFLCVCSMAMMNARAHFVLQRDVELVCNTQSDELSDVSFLLRSTLKFAGFEHDNSINGGHHHRGRFGHHDMHNDRHDNSFRIDIGSDDDDDYHPHRHHHHHNHHRKQYVPKFQIECIVEGLILPVTDTTTTTNMPLRAPTSASLTPAMYTTEMTPVDRLKDLEAAKSLLSAEEYESKREAILRDI